MTELQKAFEEGFKEPYGFKNHLPEVWKQEPQFEVDKINRWYYYMYNIIMNQITECINNLFKK